MTIENRNLQPGTRLAARYHKQPYSCTVVEGEGGKLRYRLEDGREFKSPSAAGMAITGKSCNGWAFWSVEVAQTAPAPESEQTQPEETSAETPQTDEEEEQGEPQVEPPVPPAEETAAAKKSFFRVPNQRGVPEGQTRWHCHECGQSFLAPAGEVPETCPQGHRPS